MSGSRDLLSIELACDRSAPAIVRTELSEVSDQTWPLDDVLLVASELVTNAVRHSGCHDTHTLEVIVRLRHGRLLISVHDPGISGAAAEPTEPKSTEPGGWGLRIIDELSEHWGAERPDGYRVWAELAVPA
jgi:anti-sigma regulatory factor (Ser/Thr protein kinase)